MGKCPPGVICIENITLLFLLILVVVVGFAIYNMERSRERNIINNIELPKYEESRGLFSKPNYSFSNIQNDVLLNPYEGPLRDDRLFPNLNMFSSRMPINIPTQSFDTNYRQIGILTKIGQGETILPLMGRPLITNRDKWNFYTISDSNNAVKLPVNSKGKKCMNYLGCDDLYTGDIVHVEGYNDKFKVTTYENDMPKYIPFI